MASTTDPRGSSFNADAFRSAIRFAMSMGLPEEESERITFRWRVERTYSNPDPTGRPFSFSEEPETVDEHDDVQVPAAVRFSSRATGGIAGTGLGEIDTPRVEVTLLDVDYALVETADIIVFDGSEYEINFVKPPDGLFDVTVYTLYATAVDEAAGG